MSGYSVAIFALSLGIVTVSINCVMLARWIGRLNRRVLDLEYPQAKAWMKDRP